MNPNRKWNESGFRPPLCRYSPEDGKMIEMTLSSRHRIRNLSPGGLRPSTLPLGHWGSPQYWLSHVDGEETFFVSFKPPRPGTEPRTLAWKAAVLTTTLGPPPWTRISLFVFEITRPSWWPIRSCCGSKLRATGFKSWSGRMLVIEVVPIQWSKLFKGMESAVMSMALCTIKNPWSYSIRLGHSPFLLSRYCHDCAESNVKQYSLEITTRV